MINLTPVVARPNILQEQKDAPYVGQPRFMFSDALEHGLDKKIYGIPLDAHVILQIEPFSLNQPPIITLHQLHFPQRNYDIESTVNLKPYANSGVADNNKDKIITRDIRENGNLNSYIGGPEQFDIILYFSDSEPKTVGNKSLLIKNPKIISEEAIIERLSMAFYTFEKTSLNYLKWSRGIYTETSRAIWCLSFFHNRHLAFKPLGTELMFFYAGFLPYQEEWEERTRRSAGAINKNAFLNTAVELNDVLFNCAPTQDTHFPFRYYKDEPYEKLLGRAHHLDYILATTDKRIYGLSWYAKMDPDKTVGSKDIKTLISTQLTPKPLRYSLKAYGSFEAGEKFGSFIEHNESIYGVPTNAASILKVRIDEIADNTPKISRFSYLDETVCGQTLRKFMSAVTTPGGVFFVPYNSSRYLFIQGEHAVRTTKEEIIGPRKFRRGTFCEMTGTVICAPFDYPHLLSISPGNQIESLYEFNEPTVLQAEKYSDIVKYDDENYFCIPFARRSILHLKKGSGPGGLEVKEYPLNTELVQCFFIRGVFAGDGIYCIPYHGNSVLKIFMKNKQVMIENYVIPIQETMGWKFSDVYVSEFNQNIVCVPLNFNFIMIIQPGNPPTFKMLSLFTTCYDPVDPKNKHITNLFEDPYASYKFISACKAAQNKTLFVPSSYGKFIFVHNKHLTIDKIDVASNSNSFKTSLAEADLVDIYKRDEFYEDNTHKNEYYNCPSHKRSMFCGAVYKDKSIFLIPNTETSLLRLRFEE